LGYYSGVAVGLLGWASPKNWTSTALLIDALLQGLAGFIDLTAIGKRARWKDKQLESNNSADASDIRTANNDKALTVLFDYGNYWRLATAVVFLTIGFQAVLFSISEWGPEKLQTNILAFFYIGVALAALVCKMFRIRLAGNSNNRRLAGNATITSEIRTIKFKLGFGVITLAAAASLVTAVLCLAWWERSSTALLFIAATAFIYQILVLSLLDQIGRVEKAAHLREMIRQTYLLVAVATIISILVLNCYLPTYFGCVMVTLFCCLVSFSAVYQRTTASA